MKSKLKAGFFFLETGIFYLNFQRSPQDLRYMACGFAYIIEIFVNLLLIKLLYFYKANHTSDTTLHRILNYLSL
jgi:hypothetical protein